MVQKMEFIGLVDLLPIMPEIIVLLTAGIVLLVDLFSANKNRSMTLAVTTIIGLILAIYAETQLYNRNMSGFYGAVVADDFSISLSVIMSTKELFSIIFS